MKRVQTIVTPPAALPVSVAEAKAQLIISHSNDDTIIERLIYATVASVEQYLQRKLITQTWKMFLDDWGGGDRIQILFGNLQSVTHVKYTDTDESQSTFSTDYYMTDTDSIPGQVILKYGQSWPADALSPKNPIEIQFVTGYGASSANVPQDIRHAIMWMVTHMYENRESTVIGQSVAEIPEGPKSLLSPHRVWEWLV